VTRPTPILRHSDTPTLVRSATLPSLAREWAALAETPFHHPLWHEVWLRHFRPAGDALFLGVRAAGGEEDEEGELLGAAALDLGPQEARELGDPNVRDFAGPSCAPGFELAVTRALLDWFEEDYLRRAALWGIPADSPIAAALAAEAADHGWSAETSVEALSPALALPSSWDEYVAGLAKHDRHELRRKLRNLEAGGSVGYQAAVSAAAIAPEMDRLLALMRASRAAKAAFLTPTMEAFFRDLATSFADLGMVRLATMTLDGAPVAMLFCFETASTMLLYNSGYDPARSPLAVGLLSKALAVRDAIERGKLAFDFLRGDEPYKRHLGGMPREVLTFDLRRAHG
jgi:CelD/BcsL family acetyltransferase involved in cellulose biosynthesis